MSFIPGERSGRERKVRVIPPSCCDGYNNTDEDGATDDHCEQ